MAVDRQKLARIFKETGADALFLEEELLRRYLTGFAATDGFAVYDGSTCTLVCDPRYIEAAREALCGSFVRVEEGAFERAVSLVAGCKTLGVPYPFISRAACERLEARGFALADCMPAFRGEMKVKTEEELSYTARACAIAEEGFSAALCSLKEGMAEREFAAELEYEMRMRGAEGTSFETIVAFGKGSSVPHHKTGDRKLRFGDVVLVDFGCKVKGYCSDCTRTFLFGDDGRHGDFKKTYALVLKAHERVKEKLRAGMTGREADAIARGFFEERGVAKYFTHSLGHGIGMQIHESPSLSPRSEERLEDGMVFSDEPGLYFTGEYGVRIEDSVCLEGGVVRSFMHKTARTLTVL